MHARKSELALASCVYGQALAGEAGNPRGRNNRDQDHSEVGRKRTLGPTAWPVPPGPRLPHDLHLTGYLPPADQTQLGA